MKLPIDKIQCHLRLDRPTARQRLVELGRRFSRAAWFGSAIMLGVSGVAAAGPKTVAASKETCKYATVLVLDIRDPGEFSSGRIPKSKNIPLADLDKRIEDIARFKEKPVIITCRANGRAGAAARLLKTKGFTNVIQLQGGFGAWQQASLPVEK